MTRRASRRDERGTVTVWAVGMVVLTMILGGIAIDLWTGFAARRELAAAVDQAAQAGANGLDEAVFRSSGVRQLDPDRARNLATESLAGQGLGDLDSVTVEASTEQVVVDVTRSVDLGLLGLLGGGDPLIVHVRAVGQPREVTP